MVADGPRPIHTQVYAYAPTSRGRASLTPDSRFVIGSISKQMTAALVLREVERKRVDLDAPIGTYLTLSADWASRVSVRQLLNHTSGVAALDKPLASEPGSTFAYSNLNYDMLGQIVERRSGQRFAAAAARLFAMCGMTSTTAADPARATGLAAGFSEERGGVLSRVKPDGGLAHVPSGGIVSTARDLVRWNLCLHGGRAVSAASYGAMTRPSSTRQHRWGTLGYGFGLQVTEQDGLTEFSHGGYVPGYIATMTFYPRARRTLVVLENTSWDADDMARVFAPHDALRAAVRADLLAKPLFP